MTKLEDWAVFTGVILVILVIVVFGIMVWITQLLWNWLIPSIFNLREITFWESLGILILSSILFKSYQFKK